MLTEVEVTSGDLVARALERITAYDVDLRAFTYVAAGASVPDGHGDLRRVPIAVKDVIDVEGMPTTASSKVLRGNVADEDATVVARLRTTRGATIVGKTNLDEFAYGVFSPPTRDPWDLERIPGGSSGGSAAAVAAGMCVGALGTDTAGSIRIPSALCGVFGLKPRPVVDMTGVTPLASSLDCCGPLLQPQEALTFRRTSWRATLACSRCYGRRWLVRGQLDFSSRSPSRSSTSTISMSNRMLLCAIQTSWLRYRRTSRVRWS